MNSSRECKSHFRIGIVFCVAITFLLLSCSNGNSEPTNPAVPQADCEKVSIADPAASYCSLMGYKYETISTENGQTAGGCKFPNGSACPEWDFYAGKCGQKFSYCAQHGYGIVTGGDGNDPYSSEYSVCVDAEGKVIGSVTELMGLADTLDSCQ